MKPIVSGFLCPFAPVTFIFLYCPRYRTFREAQERRRGHKALKKPPAKGARPGQLGPHYTLQAVMEFRGVSLSGSSFATHRYSHARCTQYDNLGKDGLCGTTSSKHSLIVQCCLCVARTPVTRTALSLPFTSRLFGRRAIVYKWMWPIILTIVHVWNVIVVCFSVRGSKS